MSGAHTRRVSASLTDPRRPLAGLGSWPSWPKALRRVESEAETTYPPLTHLRPISKQEIRTEAGATFIVLTAKPSFG